MGELNERIWAVISERGCERSGLAYAQAARLVRKLAKEKARGLCVVTDVAARHLAPVNPAPARRRRAPEGRRKLAGGQRRHEATASVEAPPPD